MRAAAELVADSLRAGREIAEQGVTTQEISTAIGNHAISKGGQLLFPGYRQGNSPPFPGEACVSVNDQVVHGVPARRRLQPGDLVSIDFGVKLNDWCGDSATSFVIPPNSEQSQANAKSREQLRTATKQILDLAIELITPSEPWSQIALKLERHTTELGYALVLEYVGHGIGTNLHEPPKVPSYWTGFTGVDFILRPGMVLAIEPLLTEIPANERHALGDRAPIQCPVMLASDGWTVSTQSEVDACHEEAMVVVTESGAERLTPAL